MATRSIVPRATGEGSIGTAEKKWGKVFANEIDKNALIPGAFNKKVTFTTSGSWIAPVTGVYRITLKGGGGGGMGGLVNPGSYYLSGNGGAEGGTTICYETLTAGTSYPYVVGAGGYAGSAGGYFGGDGGNSTVTIGATVYTAGGGSRNGNGGTGTIPGAASPQSYYYSGSVYGSPGGGAGGGSVNNTPNGVLGGGGAGGNALTDGITDGGAGGDGFISFEYYDPTL